MYGKYDEKKLERVRYMYKRWGVLDDDGIIKTESLMQLYIEFLENIETLRGIFPYRKISVDKIKEAEEGRVWRWDSDEEKEKVVAEIRDFGMFLPLIVLDKWISNNGNPASEFYNVLDGNHRMDAIRKLPVHSVDAFIFPEDCKGVRKKLLNDYEHKRNIISPVEMNVPHPAISKMNIERLNGIPFRYLTEKVVFTNRMEAYNAALALGHELTPFLYEYTNKHDDYPEEIKKMAFKVLQKVKEDY